MNRIGPVLHFLTKAKIIFNRVNCKRVLHLIELIEIIFQNQRQVMANGTVPYLCGGTFLCQVLRAKKPSVTATEHTKGKKTASLNRKHSGGLFPYINLVIFLIVQV